MPFTFAHPAVVIPIKNKWGKYFDLTALVLGSMAPDFEYFLKLKIESRIGHTFIGFIVYNLTLVIIFAIIFNKIIKQTLLSYLPIKISSILKTEDVHNSLSFKEISLKKSLIFIVSALFGMLSHVLWDSFTHETGTFVKIFSILSLNILEIPLYKILQHGSTLVGLVYMLKILYSNRTRMGNIGKDVEIKKKVYYWVSIATITSVFIISRSISIIHYLTPSTIGTFLVTTISGFFISLTLVSILFFKRKYDVL